MTKCLGDRISATKDVENNISIIATFPSSLLNIFENGSVWYIRNPLEVPSSRVRYEQNATSFVNQLRTNCQAAIILVESHKVHSHLKNLENESRVVKDWVDCCAEALGTGRVR